MDYVWLALLFPLAGFLVNALLGRWLPRRAHGVIATAAIGCAFVVALVVLFSLLGLPHEDRHRDVFLYQWVTTGSGAGFGPDPTMMTLRTSSATDCAEDMDCDMDCSQLPVEDCRTARGLAVNGHDVQYNAS